MSGTRAVKYQGWEQSGLDGGRSQRAGLIPRGAERGGGADSTLPAHTARDSQLCPQRLLAGGPASTRLQTLDSSPRIFPEILHHHVLFPL